MNTLLRRQRQIRRPHVHEEVGVAEAGDGRRRADRVAPHTAKFRKGDGGTIDVAVENVLMRGRTEFHDDVAHLLRKPRVADQGDKEVFFLSQIMGIADADKRMCLEGGQDAVDGGTDGRRSTAWRLRPPGEVTASIATDTNATRDAAVVIGPPGLGQCSPFDA